ncbi:hypothetical protein LG201_00700 [Methylobacillus gramineus]|uniref:hypothetical protein n=1 Tax=Methylobacillus gramineus TaxID=755169 RepID=UPI001CFFAF2D|nr:hypothetical protein [Methylobacillus gramineus]MCB5183722.1 hypothetical protein [Methylobacillus gramineus]
MKFRLHVVLFIFAILIAPPVLARAVTAVINYEDVPIISASGKSLQASDVEQAIITGAGINQWTISRSENGELIATLVVRDKHTIAVNIPYTADKYSILYRSSDNMKYDVKYGVPSIHPFYNKWVSALKSSIDRELLRR